MQNEVSRESKNREAVRQWLRERKLSYGGEKALVAPIEIDGVSCSLISLVLQRGLVMVCSTPLTIPKDRLPHVYELALRLNDHFPYGGFELGEASDKLVYKVSTFYLDDKLASSQIEDCYRIIRFSFKTYYSALKAVADGFSDVEAVLNRLFPVNESV
jgi:hypothetical protein